MRDVPGNVDLSLPANIGLASAVAMKETYREPLPNRENCCRTREYRADSPQRSVMYGSTGRA